jgi:hypothetical protein
VTTDALGQAVRSITLTSLQPFPVPVGGDLPAPLAEAVADYERVRAEH